MKRSHDPQMNRLAFELARLIEARHLTVKELAEQVDLSYEQTRRLINGTALPSREALERISKILDADRKQLTTMLFAAKSQRVYGTDVVSEMTGKNPELAPIEASWPHLDSEQRAILIDIAKGMVFRNRVNRRAADAIFPPKVTVEGFRRTRSSQSPENKVKR
jgi:transcriptional regulator with XRE-family HTH domain